MVTKGKFHCIVMLCSKFVHYYNNLCHCHFRRQYHFDNNQRTCNMTGELHSNSSSGIFSICNETTVLHLYAFCYQCLLQSTF